jgi:hypothetical protein
MNKFLLSFYKCAIAGMAAFVGIHILLVLTWDRLFSPSAGTEAWWLNTRGSMTLTLVMLFFATFAVLSRSSASNLAKVALALALWIGIVLGILLSELTLQSEPNLGPIPFILGAVLTLPTVALGWLAAIGLTKLVHHPRHRPNGATIGEQP